MRTLIVLLAVLSVALGQGIGDRLTYNAEAYDQIPLTASAAQNANWNPLGDGSCDPNLGIAYNADGESYPDNSHPLIAYYTSGGQLAGIGIEHFGAPANNMDQFWVGPNAAGNYRMVATFRAPEQLCSGQTYRETIGTQVVINQDSLAWPVPLNDSAATDALFTTGSCIQGMGYHWSYDMEGAPNMTWVSSNLVPVVPMYVNGQISAFFFTTPNVQRPWPIGAWEGPIPSFLMCKNWCSSSCKFDVSFWSTLHFYLANPSNDNCPSKIYCPPN